MAGKNRNFGRPIPTPEEIPDYVKKFEKVRPLFPGATIDDFAWLGEDGNLDPQPIVDEIIASDALLRLVVQAVVGGNATSNKSSESRVEAAMRALLGVRGPKGRRHLSSDGPVLRKMAIEYLQGFHGFKEPHPSLSSLANWALRQDPGFAEKNEEWKQNKARTICRKFEKLRNRLMIEVSSNNDWEVQSALAKVKAAMQALKDIGIQLSVPIDDGTKSPELNP